MSDSAKYTFGGISKRNGMYKVRVGQGDRTVRTKLMMKKGHTDIDLIDFSGKLTKLQICEELLKIDRFQQFKDVILETISKKSGGPVAAPKNKTATVTKVKTKSANTKKVDDDLVFEQLKQLVA